MLIAFEGPDNVGKSTAAAKLSSEGVAVYNATKQNHAVLSKDSAENPDLVGTFDRIDWLSHMVYRLALPDRDWNDDRPRTVFAMPDTHLVFKLHHPGLADFTVPADGEDATASNRTRGVETKIGLVNPLYFHFADFFMGLNEERDYALFKTISMLEVQNTDQGYTQQLISFSSPVTELNEMPNITDEELLEFLRADDHQRI